MDRLSLKGMQFYGYHGAYEAEKEMGQPIEVDIDLLGDFSSSSQTDDVELSVSYGDIYAIVKDLVEEREFNLIQALAEAIAEEVLASCDVDRVTVRVRKPMASIGGIIQAVEAELTRPISTVAGE